LAKWQSRRIDEAVLLDWINDDVREKWGIKGAVRVLAISRTGWDVGPKGDLKNKRPSDVATANTREVPGIDPPVSNAFGISQALTWLAGQRNELQEDLEWRSQVPQLMQMLMNRQSTPPPLFAK